MQTKHKDMYINIDLDLSYWLVFYLFQNQLKECEDKSMNKGFQTERPSNNGEIQRGFQVTLQYVMQLQNTLGQTVATGVRWLLGMNHPTGRVGEAPEMCFSIGAIPVRAKVDNKLYINRHKRYVVGSAVQRN